MGLGFARDHNREQKCCLYFKTFHCLLTQKTTSFLKKGTKSFGLSISVVLIIVFAEGVKPTFLFSSVVT